MHREPLVKQVWKVALVFLALAFVQEASAQNNPDWTTPIKPFRIAEGLYYVGSKDLASYLVVTREGNILINSGLESSPALIRASIEQLGFKYADTKILLISHAHWDHDAGSARVIQETGAKYMVMDADVPVVESGGALDFAYADTPYPKAKVDRVLHDGDEVRLGDAVLVAHKTGGHTRGCTTWTMKVKQQGKTLDAVIVGSWYVNPGFRLVDKPQQPASYPGIADDYRKTFAVLKKLPCDIFLGAHGAYFNMMQKLSKVNEVGESVWIDPQGYRAALAEREQAFEAELRKQRG
ncbi:MAG TPA: subclass B3 metallo-beta-lactamase [Steroidobacteraceae bacterium]|nr:subclass B3 metallo-beta-lactamase [Steroidobacteraceae bacterium]